MHLFISYRRTDSDIAGRIADRMIAEFGADAVFYDVDSIPIGQDFRAAIDDAIKASSCVLVLVGPGWIRASGKDQGEQGTLASPTDFVRLELESALKQKKPVIPVLLGGVAMPDSTTLPSELCEFSFLNATTVRSGRDYQPDISLLVSSIRRIHGNSHTTHAKPVASQERAHNALNLSFVSKELIDHPGSLVGKNIGRYLLQEFVASGGGGAVYRATSNISRTVCLKIAFPVSESIESLKKMVARGVKGIVQMKHPGIVTVHDFESIILADDKNSFFLTMDFEPGANLERWSESLGASRESCIRRLRCAISIARTMNDCHNFRYIGEDGFEAVGILHGDIKPNNIVIVDGAPKLLDFMLIDVQKLQEQNVSDPSGFDACTRAFGTPAYMAPEQENGTVTRRSDIYSLGVTLKQLFQTDISEFSEIQAPLFKLIDACMSPLPAGRPESMASVADEMTSILANFENQVRPIENQMRPSLVERITRFFSRT